MTQEQRAATRENVERRLARTADELAEEDSDEGEVSDPGEASDDEEVVPYNPKNLPLDWDGKVHTHTHTQAHTHPSTHTHTHTQPIPYWLYKLHGLNLSYTCEICGNAIYKGPKNFQRHFSVSQQHTHTHTFTCAHTHSHRSGVTPTVCVVWGYPTRLTLPMSLPLLTPWLVSEGV